MLVCIVQTCFFRNIINQNSRLSIELSGLDIPRRLHNHLRLDLEGGRNILKYHKETSKEPISDLTMTFRFRLSLSRIDESVDTIPL